MPDESDDQAASANAQQPAAGPEPDANAAPAAQAASQTASGPQLRVIAQYIKDLSFENPDPMTALRAGQPAPAIDVGIDVQARKAQGDAFEVDLNVNVRAKREDTVVFICELKYAGLFQFVNVPADAVEPLLLVESPRMLFPFARRIVAEATRDGGFPPLYIDPIDFMGLYQQQRGAKGPNANTPADGGAPAGAA